MKAIPNSNPQKAIINDKGNNPTKKKITPLAMMLYVNPLRIARSMCP
jgi:hypothetical protein